MNCTSDAMPDKCGCKIIKKVPGLCVVPLSSRLLISNPKVEALPGGGDVQARPAHTRGDCSVEEGVTMVRRPWYHRPVQGMVGRSEDVSVRQVLHFGSCVFKYLVGGRVRACVLSCSPVCESICACACFLGRETVAHRGEDLTVWIQ